MDHRFDDDVLRAIEKWPNVPACYGWLALDRRGYWLIKGARITHRRALEFLGRNYASDEDGSWYVQNGPQRAYCDLDYTPWVYRLDGANGIVTHTGIAVTGVSDLYVDDAGDVLLLSEVGIGLLDDRDLVTFVEGLEIPGVAAGDNAEWLAGVGTAGAGQLTATCADRRVAVHAIAAADVSGTFRFVARPRDPGS